MNISNILKTVLFVVILAPSPGFSNENNFYTHFGASYSHTDNNVISDSRSLTGNITIPIHKFIGTKFSGIASKLDNSNNLGLFGSLYLNDSHLGAVVMSYNYSKSFYNKYPDITAKGLEITGIYYYGRFNFLANRYRSTASANGLSLPDLNVANMGLAAFLTENTLISVNKGLLDIKKMWGGEISYLPIALGQKFAFDISFYKQPSNDNSFQVGINYYPGKRQSLKYHKRVEFN